MKRAWTVLLLTGIACDSPIQPASEPVSGFQFSQAQSNAPDHIVILRSNASPNDVARDHGVNPRYVYSEALNGFAGSIAEAARSGLMRDARVLRIEQDGVVTLTGTQTPAPWGLDRLDQRTRPLDGTYQYQGTGAGVTAYIIDTGIRYTHADFGGRAVFGYDAYGGNGVDCHSHGTHVAGTVGGATYGVAKQVKLVGLRVLDCSGSGSVSGAIAGIDWILRNLSLPAVANLSLGASASAALDDAVTRLVQAGVSVAVAAGNSAVDACTVSPARAPAALTVGASDQSDNRASWSNYGSCLDLFAPGVGISSAGSGSDTEVRSKSGTSMASPHVAGAAALVLQRYPNATGAMVADTLRSWSTPNAVGNASSAQANLLYTLGGSGGLGLPAVQNVAPKAAFTVKCTALDCTFTDQSSDIDGSVVSWAWDFGDGTGSQNRNATHRYATAGTYQVKLVATDNTGAVASALAAASPTMPAKINLSAMVRKSKNARFIDLSWSGAATLRVDLFRNGQLLSNVANSGAYTDIPTGKGGGSATYRVCEAGTTICSASLTVAY